MKVTTLCTLAVLVMAVAAALPSALATSYSTPSACESALFDWHWDHDPPYCDTGHRTICNRFLTKGECDPYWNVCGWNETATPPFCSGLLPGCSSVRSGGSCTSGTGPYSLKMYCSLNTTDETCSFKPIPLASTCRTATTWQQCMEYDQELPDGCRLDTTSYPFSCEPGRCTSVANADDCSARTTCSWNPSVEQCQPVGHPCSELVATFGVCADPFTDCSVDPSGACTSNRTCPSASTPRQCMEFSDDPFSSLTYGTGCSWSPVNNACQEQACQFVDGCYPTGTQGACFGDITTHTCLQTAVCEMATTWQQCSAYNKTIPGGCHLDTGTYPFTCRTAMCSSFSNSTSCSAAGSCEWDGLQCLLRGQGCANLPVDFGVCTDPMTDCAPDPQLVCRPKDACSSSTTITSCLSPRSPFTSANETGEGCRWNSTTGCQAGMCSHVWQENCNSASTGGACFWDVTSSVCRQVESCETASTWQQCMDYDQLLPDGCRISSSGPSTCVSGRCATRPGGECPSPECAMSEAGHCEPGIACNGVLFPVANCVSPMTDCALDTYGSCVPNTPCESATSVAQCMTLQAEYEHNPWLGGGSGCTWDSNTCQPYTCEYYSENDCAVVHSDACRWDGYTALCVQAIPPPTPLECEQAGRAWNWVSGYCLQGPSCADTSQEEPTCNGQGNCYWTGSACSTLQPYCPNWNPAFYCQTVLAASPYTIGTYCSWDDTNAACNFIDSPTHSICYQENSNWNYQLGQCDNSGTGNCASNGQTGCEAKPLSCIWSVGSCWDAPDCSRINAAANCTAGHLADYCKWWSYDHQCHFNEFTEQCPPATEEPCWSTGVFSNDTCQWEGTQPPMPTVQCYETASWSNETCAWNITGTQPAQPQVEGQGPCVFDHSSAPCQWSCGCGYFGADDPVCVANCSKVVSTCSPCEAVFSSWGTCSATCGGGTQTRSQTLIPPTGYPYNCPRSRDCNTQPCPRRLGVNFTGLVDCNNNLNIITNGTWRSPTLSELCYVVALSNTGPNSVGALSLRVLSDGGVITSTALPVHLVPGEQSTLKLSWAYRTPTPDELTQMRLAVFSFNLSFTDETTGLSATSATLTVPAVALQLDCAYSTHWSACSVTCGSGTQTRAVVLQPTANGVQCDATTCACDTGVACASPFNLTLRYIWDYGRSIQVTDSTLRSTQPGDISVFYTLTNTGATELTSVNIMLDPADIGGSGWGVDIAVAPAASIPLQISYGYRTLLSDELEQLLLHPIHFNVTGVDAVSGAPVALLFQVTPPITIQIDCVYSDWGACSATCGSGTQTRTIIQQPTANGVQCTLPTSQGCDTGVACPAPPSIRVEFVGIRDCGSSDYIADGIWRQALLLPLCYDYTVTNTGTHPMSHASHTLSEPSMVTSAYPINLMASASGVVTFHWGSRSATPTETAQLAIVPFTFNIVYYDMSTSQSADSGTVNVPSVGFALDCALSSWSACTGSCGLGSQTRTITQQPTSNGVSCGDTFQLCDTGVVCNSSVSTPSVTAAFAWFYAQAGDAPLAPTFAMRTIPGFLGFRFNFTLSGMLPGEDINTYGGANPTTNSHTVYIVNPNYIGPTRRLLSVLITLSTVTPTDQEFTAARIAPQNVSVSFVGVTSGRVARAFFQTPAVPIQIDCAYSNWTACSESCGFGTRTRTVAQPATSLGVQCTQPLQQSCFLESCLPPPPPPPAPNATLVLSFPDGQTFVDADLLGASTCAELMQLTNATLCVTANATTTSIAVTVPLTAARLIQQFVGPDSNVTLDANTYPVFGSTSQLDVIEQAMVLDPPNPDQPPAPTQYDRTCAGGLNCGGGDVCTSGLCGCAPDAQGFCIGYDPLHCASGAVVHFADVCEDARSAEDALVYSSAPCSDRHPSFENLFPRRRFCQSRDHTTGTDELVLTGVLGDLHEEQSDLPLLVFTVLSPYPMSDLLTLYHNPATGIIAFDAYVSNLYDGRPPKGSKAWAHIEFRSFYSARYVALTKLTFLDAIEGDANFYFAGNRWHPYPGTVPSGAYAFWNGTGAEWECQAYRVWDGTVCAAGCNNGRKGMRCDQPLDPYADAVGQWNAVTMLYVNYGGDTLVCRAGYHAVFRGCVVNEAVPPPDWGPPATFLPDEPGTDTASMVPAGTPIWAATLIGIASCVTVLGAGFLAVKVAQWYKLRRLVSPHPITSLSSEEVRPLAGRAVASRPARNRSRR